MRDAEARLAGVIASGCRDASRVDRAANVLAAAMAPDKRCFRQALRNALVAAVARRAGLPYAENLTSTMMQRRQERELRKTLDAPETHDRRCGTKAERLLDGEAAAERPQAPDSPPLTPVKSIARQERHDATERASAEGEAAHEPRRLLLGREDPQIEPAVKGLGVSIACTINSA